jgi:hypothetical protein
MIPNYHAHAIADLCCKPDYTDAALIVTDGHWSWERTGGETFSSEFQLFLSSFKGGAFHPTADGRAVIADALAKEAWKALQEQ